MKKLYRSKISASRRIASLSISSISVSTLLLTAFSLTAMASPISFPGLIPMTGEHQQASDLIYQGRNLIPDEVTQLISQGVDTSLINPNEQTDLWKDKVGGPLNPNSYQLQLPPVAEFNFDSDSANPLIGFHRFTISAVDNQGIKRTYNAIMGKKAHNILLRKALLEKIGYTIPEIQWIPKMRLHFAGAFSKKEFPKNLLGLTATQGTPDRWILNISDETSDYFDLQDVILTSSTEYIINLGSGFISPETIQGRRLLNSLLVPYNLTDIPESLNTFNWVPGRIVNEGIYLPYSENKQADNFSTSYEDGRWIARRIAKLTREDFVDIVKAASLPNEVSLLAVEKLISRRDILAEMFKLDAGSLHPNTHISSGTTLVNGKLTQIKWPGYAPYFSFGDPSSPINGAEIGAFFRSRVFSTSINNVIAELNKSMLKSESDKLQQKWLDHQFGLLRDQLVTLSQTGKFKKVPFKMYSIPTFSGGLIASREVVIGSFMGTDNLIQMADTFGYQLSPGYYLGFDGLTDPLQMTGKANIQILRTYSHVKPLKSIRTVSKEPYSNILVPYFQSQIEKGMKSILTNPSATPSAEDLNRINEVANLLKEKLQVGESLIMSDNYTAGVSLAAAYPISVSADIQLKLSESMMLINRLQIFKKDENTIQIYKDPGLANMSGIAFGLNVYRVPILTISWNNAKGGIKTEFNSLDLTSPTEKDSDGKLVLKQDANFTEYYKSYQALYRVLNEGEVDLVQAQQKPITIQHKFSQNSFGFGLFLSQNKSQTAEDDILLKTREGYEKSYLYRSMAQRSGIDYQTLVLNTLQSIIQSKTGYANLAIDDTGSGNPSDTLFGSSVTRTVSLEAEQFDKNPKGPIKESYIQVSHLHKGWQVTNTEALKILEKFNKQFGTNLTWPGMINDTRLLQLYLINLKISVYQDGIESLARVTPEELKLAFQRVLNPALNNYLSNENIAVRKDAIYRTDLMNRFMYIQKKYLSAQAKGDGQEQAEVALQMVSAAEMFFPGKQLIALVGGEDNLLVQAQISGFREGDETAVDPKTDMVSSNTIGIIGSRKFNGPIHFVQSNYGISEGEFFIYWLMNRL